MFCVWQMSDGRWRVDAFTRAPREAKNMALYLPCYQTEAEALFVRSELENRASRSGAAP